MLVDGKKIAGDLLARVRNDVQSLSKAPRLSVLTCAPNFETQKYLAMKKSKAAAVGIAMNVVELPEDTTTKAAVASLVQMAADSDGVVVQLPLPAQIDVDEVLRAIPIAKDPDGFHYCETASSCLSPVVGAIDEISRIHSLDWAGKQVVVLGEGRLVGLPALRYAKQKKAVVTVMNKDSFDSGSLMKADIIVSGMGVPKRIVSSMVQPGVVVFDAGTSEDGGVLVGDVDPDVEEVATLVTPVPGGIGPITIAYLLHNVTALASR